MKGFFLNIKNDYVETRSRPREDFLEWFIQRKLTWGQCWGLVLILNFIIQPFFVQFSRLSMDILDWGDPVYFLSIWTTIFPAEGNL
ncbi:TPA: hypothetical protein ACGO2L_001353 [Streptococcus suis]